MGGCNMVITDVRTKPASSCENTVLGNSWSRITRCALTALIGGVVLL